MFLVAIRAIQAHCEQLHHATGLQVGEHHLELAAEHATTRIFPGVGPHGLLVESAGHLVEGERDVVSRHSNVLGRVGTVGEGEELKLGLEDRGHAFGVSHDGRDGHILEVVAAPAFLRVEVVGRSEDHIATIGHSNEGRVARHVLAGGGSSTLAVGGGTGACPLQVVQDAVLGMAQEVVVEENLPRLIMNASRTTSRESHAIGNPCPSAETYQGAKC